MQRKLQFPEGVSLDLNKLTLSGHSLGGITVIGTAVRDARIKVCLPLDPWFFPYLDLQPQLCLPPKTSLLMISTESNFKRCKRAGKFDQLKELKSFFQNNKYNTRHVKLLKTDHLNQTDMIVTMCLELQLMENGLSKHLKRQELVAQLYLLNAWV